MEPRLELTREDLDFLSDFHIQTTDLTPEVSAPLPKVQFPQGEPVRRSSASELSGGVVLAKDYKCDQADGFVH